MPTVNVNIHFNTYMNGNSIITVEHRVWFNDNGEPYMTLRVGPTTMYMTPLQYNALRATIAALPDD